MGASGHAIKWPARAIFVDHEAAADGAKDFAHPIIPAHEQVLPLHPPVAFEAAIERGAESTEAGERDTFKTIFGELYDPIATVKGAGVFTARKGDAARFDLAFCLVFGRP